MGIIFDVQSFSLQDGPGIRTTVFCKGCNLRCYWCHNPESWNREAELQFFAGMCIGCGACAAACPRAKGGLSARFTSACTRCGRCAEECYSGALRLTGRFVSAEELTELLLRDRDLFEQSGGGVTFSGGEPFLQPEFLCAALRAAKEAGINTAVETAACVPWEVIAAALPWVDLLFCDVKCVDGERHRAATGADNRLILDNIRRMSGQGVNLRLRTPVIPGFNDTCADMEAVAAFVLSLPNRHPLELLPFHGIAVGKYTSLHRRYEAEGRVTPGREQMAELERVLSERGCLVIPSH